MKTTNIADFIKPAEFLAQAMQVTFCASVDDDFPEQLGPLWTLEACSRRRKRKGPTLATP